MDHQPHDGDLEKFGAVSGMEGLTPLDVFDLIVGTLPPGSPLRADLVALREGIADQEQMVAEARQVIEKLEEVVKKVTSPANRIGTFLAARRATPRTSSSAVLIISATSTRESKSGT